LVERRFLLVVDGLAGEVIEHDRLPSGALERQLGGRRIALGQVRARAAALALREAGGRTQRRRARGREAQGLQQPAPGQTAAVVFLEQSGQVITHRTLPPERRVCAGRRRRVESVTTCHEAGARRANASSAACSAASALPRATLVARWRACARTRNAVASSSPVCTGSGGPSGSRRLCARSVQLSTRSCR